MPRNAPIRGTYRADIEGRRGKHRRPHPPNAFLSAMIADQLSSIQCLEWMGGILLFLGPPPRIGSSPAEAPASKVPRNVLFCAPHRKRRILRKFANSTPPGHAGSRETKDAGENPPPCRTPISCETRLAQEFKVEVSSSFVPPTPFVVALCGKI